MLVTSVPYSLKLRTVLSVLSLQVRREQYNIHLVPGATLGHTQDLKECLVLIYSRSVLFKRTGICFMLLVSAVYRCAPAVCAHGPLPTTPLVITGR